MKKLLLLLILALMLPFAAPTFACAEECVPAEEATEETPEEAMLRRYVNKLTALGGTYTGGNRFQVMKQIFEIEKLA